MYRPEEYGFTQTQNSTTSPKYQRLNTKQHTKDKC